jgi:hypothetical protein
VKALWWLLWCAALVCGSGCNAVLGIEERKLDVSELTADGYEGCEPGNNLCDGCTSAWHTCICKGWRSTPEAELRKDCADEAPASIRAKVREEANEGYEEFLEERRRERDAGQDDDADDGDDAVDDADDAVDDADDAVDDADDAVDDADDDADDSAPVVDDGATDDDGAPDLTDLTVFNGSFCDFQNPPDDCTGCFCGECGGQISSCQSDRACAEIMDCVLRLDCDPMLDASPDACLRPEFCGDLIDDNGGRLGRALIQTRETLKCAIDRGCPCGDPMQELGCNPADGCDSCGNCWGRCFCEGKSDGECQAECGSPECTADAGCAMCNDCMDQCFCLGLGDRGVCIDNCAPGGADCRPELGCECDNCFDQCLCGGNTFESCEEQCGVGPAPLCEGNLDCSGCSTCGGSCYCEDPGGPFQECMTSCQIDGCVADNCDSCTSCQTRCECDGKDPNDCLFECSGLTCSTSFASDCDSCACDRCTAIFAECEQHALCIEMMACIESTGCYDVFDCSKPALCGATVDRMGGLNDPLMGVVEALHSCRMTSGCACYGGTVGPSNPPADPGPGMPSDPGAPSDIICGDFQCAPYVPPPPNPIAAACCAGVNGQQCGIEAGPIFGTSFQTECLAWEREGRDEPECPAFAPSFPPYSDEPELRGCCTPSDLCGLMDDITGLGCLDAYYFGFSAEEAVACDYGQ